MEKIEQKIYELGFDDFSCVKFEKTYILLYKLYKYYEEINDENFQISPYYIASNFSYFKSKELIEYLNNLGYQAKLCNHEVYDQYLTNSGGIRGKNNLFYFEGLGSTFCVQMIETNYPLEEKKIPGMSCINCKKCIRHCPMGAISENGLEPEKCIRYRMNSFDDKTLLNKTTQLLGCDECQKNCPNNNINKDKISFDQFNKEKILNGDLSGISELVGSNMARKKRLIFQAMCIINHTKEKRFYENVEKYLHDDMLKEIAKSVCENLNKD